MKPRFPVEKLTARWVETLSKDRELIRVLYVGTEYVYRVVPHGEASWRAQRRTQYGWETLRSKPKRARVPTERSWRTPEAAMVVVEAELGAITPTKEKK